MADVARRERAGYRLAFEDRFESEALDSNKWLAFYLPHWSTIERTRPRYRMEGGYLTLRIDAEQEPWCPHYDGEVIVSSIQTGHFSGPIGSPIGQHRFREGLKVTEEHPVQRLYVPQYGYFELRAKADLSPGSLAALFMIGFEDEPERSGEITIMEIFGDGIGPKGTRLGHGIKKINDPRLVTEFFEDPLPFDVGEFHIYAAEWTSQGVSFFLDDGLLHHVAQSPSYPMQFMLNLYVLPGAPPEAKSATFTIDYVRGFERLE